MGGIKHTRWNLAVGNGPADKLQAAPAVAHMQVQNAGLTGHQSGDVCGSGEAQQLIAGRLAGAMIANRHFADAKEGFDKYQVTLHTAGKRRRRYMVATGVAPGVESVLTQCVNRRQQLAWTPRYIVGAEQPDHGGHATGCELAQQLRWYAGAEARLTAATGHMHVSIDQTRDQPRAI